MPRRLRYTEKARDDLDAVWAWLSRAGSGRAARRRLAAIRNDIHGGYRALYRVHRDTGHDETAGDVLVLRVFGPGQSRERL